MPSNDNAAAQPQRRTLSRKPIVLLGILGIGIVAAFPLVKDAVADYRQAAEVRGLHDLAIRYIEAAPAHTEFLGAPVESRWYSVTVENLPSEEDDARIRFHFHTPKGDKTVLARGRFEDGRWQLTYVEVQTTFGPWFVFGELGGYQRTGRLEPIRWPEPKPRETPHQPSDSVNPVQ